MSHVYLIMLAPATKSRPKKWQARRDSNPQHPDLESGALTVRATGLHFFQDLLRFLMNCMCPAKRTIFLKCQFVWCFSFIFCARVVSILTIFTGQCNNITHSLTVSPYSKISLITPAPTVLPPSRMANLNSFSIAMGVISFASIVTLSPGITISTPSGKVTTPVTSVVLK